LVWLRQQRLTEINLQTPHQMSIFISQKNHYPLQPLFYGAKPPEKEVPNPDFERLGVVDDGEEEDEQCWDCAGLEE
jgi:hypothetical protein